MLRDTRIRCVVLNGTQPAFGTCSLVVFWLTTMAPDAFAFRHIQQTASEICEIDLLFSRKILWDEVASSHSIFQLCPAAVLSCMELDFAILFFLTAPLRVIFAINFAHQNFLSSSIHWKMNFGHSDTLPENEQKKKMKITPWEKISDKHIGPKSLLGSTNVFKIH